MRGLFRRAYGESVVHLLVLSASFAVCGYALALLLERDWHELWRVLAWFVGAALLHDLVLVPLYAGADLLLQRLLRLAGAGARFSRSLVNHVRVPAVLALLLLLVYWPLISRAAPARYRSATLLDPGVFRGRWLVITAVLFCASALHLAVAEVWARRRHLRG